MLLIVASQLLEVVLFQNLYFSLELFSYLLHLFLFFLYLLKMLFIFNSILFCGF